MTLEYKGVFPAPPTPVTDDGRIHEKALRALLEDNIAHGANGFWMAGTTGEGNRLTDEERREVLRVAESLGVTRPRASASQVRPARRA